MKEYVYADNAATTRLSNKAFESMLPYLQNEYGNASQLYSFARLPKKALKKARQVIANCIGAQPSEIFFTSCGTESDNWVINGAVQQHLPIVTSSIEHHAILRPCEAAKRCGCSVSLLPVTKEGIVLSSSVKEVVHSSCGLLSVMYANNEIGTIQPIKELATIAHENGWLMHTDAVQAMGHTRINVRELGIDMLSASAHKFNGPKGIGFLYIKEGIDWPSLIKGGAQEKGLRAGTENVASIVGMATALEENVISICENESYLAHLEEILISNLSRSGIVFYRNGAENHIRGNVSLSFPNRSGESIMHRLDLKGICVSTGSACDSKETQISHVLKAIGLEEMLAKGTIRISLSKYNTEQDMIKIVQVLVGILKEESVK
ncbi:cysteine desulfurase [Prevotella copri]|uniref:cysteine desulfurase n=1 Tax=Segatella copri TaxID=165179 RepID=A0A646HIQ5_9BACT|nr:cysteine desulfurase family protein [Segatella copri]MQN91384.1 cysteine desulfurase [Segatella copri]MQO77225.1 cysteine desulfurase [Segatella copri]